MINKTEIYDNSRHRVSRKVNTGYRELISEYNPPSLLMGSLAIAVATSGFDMEFDWIDCHFDLKKIPPREVEEAFEDPFSIRLLPETDHSGADARYFALGKTLNNRFLFSVFWTDGKNYRVIFCRQMTRDESSFYERKNAEWI